MFKVNTKDTRTVSMTMVLILARLDVLRAAVSVGGSGGGRSIHISRRTNLISI